MVRTARTNGRDTPRVTVGHGLELTGTQPAWRPQGDLAALAEQMGGGRLAVVVHDFILAGRGLGTIACARLCGVWDRPIRRNVLTIVCQMVKCLRSIDSTT